MNFTKVHAIVAGSLSLCRFRLPDGTDLVVRHFELRVNPKGDVDLVLVIPQSGYELYATNGRCPGEGIPALGVEPCPRWLSAGDTPEERNHACAACEVCRGRVPVTAEALKG
jgi:hypothetical protein